jgi:hypothetical protein
MTTNPTLTIRRSITYKYADGALDNMSAEYTVPMGTDNDAAAIGTALEQMALALGQTATVDSDTGFMLYSKPAFTYSAPTEGSSRSSGSGSAGRSSGNRGGYTSNGSRSSRNGDSGGARREANYSKGNADAMWELFDKDADLFFDNLDNDRFPNIKPKSAAFGELNMDAPDRDDIKPLYLKSAPDWAKDKYGN